MSTRSRSLWLILLLLCAGVALRAFDAATPADGWEQLDEARFEALPVEKPVVSTPVEQQVRAPERNAAKPVRFAQAEIFRPPIG